MAGDPDIVVTGTPTKRDPDEVVLVVDGKEIAGWEAIGVTLSCEGFPNRFSVRMSPKDDVTAKAGDRVTVLLGRQPVISGWIDRDVSSGDARSHAIELVGRGQTCDLVDCSAEWPSHQLISGDALSIAQKLAQPYGIAVELGDGASAGPEVTPWAINYGETPADIVQRLARNAGLIAYEDARGKLILAVAGSKSAAGGVVYGKNLLSWRCENALDQRYSDYVCMGNSSDVLGDLAGDDVYKSATDPGVTRHRQLDIVLQQVAANPHEFTEKRARWEAARRLGRGQTVAVTVDRWRDDDGKLWTPNTLVSVDIPGNRAGKELLLVEVTFRRDDQSGTVADLRLMPRQALDVEPIVLVPVNTADLR